MKYLSILFAALIFSACSMQGMVEKAVPENVIADHAAHVDRLLEKDTSRIETAFKLEAVDEASQKQLDQLLANVPDGAEIRRDYVGMNSAVAVNVGEGKTRDINLVSEVQTDAGFMLVTTQYALDGAGDCCMLTNINVEKFETSPMRETLETFARVGKIIGIIILLGILGLVFFLTRRSRRKKREKASSAV